MQKPFWRNWSESSLSVNEFGVKCWTDYELPATCHTIVALLWVSYSTYIYSQIHTIYILNIQNNFPSIAAIKLSPAWPASHHTFQSALCFPESAKNMIMLLNIILLVTFWSISSSSEETFISAFLSCALSLAISIALALCLPARVSPALASWSSAPVLVSSYSCSPAVCLGWGV